MSSEDFSGSRHFVRGYARPARGAQAPTLVCLHGWLGDGRDFACLDRAAGLQDRALVALNLPGHGPNPRPTAANFEATVEALIQSLPREPFDLLGYSMGGRLAWSAAATGRLPALRRLVVVSAHPGLTYAEARTARKRGDEERAAFLEHPAFDTKAFLEAWYRAPLFGALSHAPGYRAMLGRRLEGSPHGWAQALRVHSVSQQPVLAHQPGASEQPVRAGSPSVVRPHLICGAEDEGYSTRYAALHAAGYPVITLEGAAHAPHIEQPDAFVEAVIASLAN